MKPYLGILIDSFWEAISSKVLWALLGLSTLVLLAIAPFGLTTERSFKFANFDINSAEKSRLIEKLAKGLDKKGTAGVKAIAQKLDPKFQDRVRKVVEPNSKEEIRTRELVEELNRLLTDKTLYNAEVFPSTEQIDRYKSIIDKLPDQVDANELEELNRRLLSATFSVELNLPRGEQVWLSYAGFKLQLIPFTQKQIRLYLEPAVLQVALKLGLAVLINFVAIIMTSWIIPDTFRSGSLHVMLSKPISRSWLFLSKFFGGCIFVTLNLVFVVVGLYLILGLRFGIWNNGLLGCIPLLLFVFIIFYSISALVGLVWGNAIVSIVACAVCWGAFVAIGIAQNTVQELAIRPQTINRVTEIEGNVLTINEEGQHFVWNSHVGIWQPATDFVVGFGERALTFGPVYDSQRKLLISKSFRIANPLDNFGNSNNRNIELIDIASPKEPESAEAGAIVSDIDKLRKTSYWSTEEGPALPPQVFAILKVGDEIIAVCRSGLYRLNSDMERKKESQESTDAISKWIKSRFNEITKDGPFELASPEGLVVTNNSAVAVTQNGTGLTLYSDGNIRQLRLSNKKFEITSELKLEGDGTEAAIVAANDAYCVVAREELAMEVFDSQLKSIGQIELRKGQSPKQLSWIPGVESQLCLVTQEGQVLNVDCKELTVRPLKLPTSGKVTCLAWRNEKEAFVGLAPNRVQLVDVVSGAIVSDYSPPSRLVEKIYRWIINPLYSLAPKPGALDDAMTYLLTGKTTEIGAMASSKRELAIWQPIASNTAFVLLVLGICCIYVTRKEY